jgi:hypothetical protein
MIHFAILSPKASVLALQIGGKTPNRPEILRQFSAQQLAQVPKFVGLF